MKTIEEKVELLLRANQRLTNELSNLTKDYESLKAFVLELCKDLDQERSSRKHEAMVKGNTYLREIENIVDSKEVEWKGHDWLNYQIKLKGYDEIFEVFTLADVCLQPGKTIQFIFSEGSKLRNLKIKNW